MKLFGLCASAASLALVTSIFSACSGSGGGAESSGTMYIETCSLGCGSGQGGFQVNCSIVQAFLNQEISITFSEAVDEGSVNSQTFQLIDELSGQVPVGTRSVDDLDPRKVIFRPSITFDDQGSASYGFTTNTTYRITVPGTQQNDPGPFIKSTGGKPNKSRMQCDIHTTDEIVDAVPGQPTVNVFVDVTLPVEECNPNDPTADQSEHVNVLCPDVQDVTDGDGFVSVQSKITFEFNDIMNPATLANLVTGQPSCISVEVDADGNVLTTDDQVPLFGHYVVEIDLVNLKTTVTYTASLGLPGGGDPSLHPTPRKVVIKLPPCVEDLAGNSLSNTDLISFTPEIIDLEPAILPDADGENFTDTLNLDADQSGAEWGGGRLTLGYGGGSGRLGPLYLRGGTTVTLDTDSQVFPLGPSQGQASLSDILNNYVPPLDPLAPDPTLTITDGQFEFSSLVIEPGATLKLTGLNPARVFSRGPVTIFGSGKIDVRGATPVQHDSSIGAGQAGGAGGPAAGSGGKGGDRIESFGTDMIGTTYGGIDFGNDNVVTLVMHDGLPGVGVGGDTTMGVGLGGEHFPTAFPTGLDMLNGLQTTLTGLLCISQQVASPGGGGAYSTNGTASLPATTAATTWTGASTTPSPTPGGSASDVDLEQPDPQSMHLKRTLAWEVDFLRGGAGGGGGGSNLYGTYTGGTEFASPPCSDEVILLNGIGGTVGPPSPLRDHSAAGGGGGGGAVQVICGKLMFLAGQVLASGGGGGSSLLLDPDPPGLNLGRRIRATPGGGGAGGGVKLQALEMSIPANPGSPQILIDDGLGGTNTLGALGGNGGTGLVRIEDTIGQISRVTESPKVNPFDPSHVNLDYYVMNPTDPCPPDCPDCHTVGCVESEGWVSVGNWVRPRRRPECYSGSVSCWMRPVGNFFQLEFGADDLTNPDPEKRYGWNMDVVYDTGSGEQLLKYRGPDPNSPFADDFETLIGNQLNHGAPDNTGSYFAVRFQGAVSSGTLADPCDVELSGTDIEIVAGSLTPWVLHPGELNELSPKPNMIRFTVVFDYSLAVPQSVPSFIKGVTNLKIRTQPD